MAANNAWINSVPLSDESLLGKVVLVNFWTYSCINSLRALPYVEGWAEAYRPAGLIVIGVHTPEFSFEKERPNVAWAVRDFTLSYPVVMDSDYAIWQKFDNDYWPAFYLIDAKGRIRYRFFGEGDYDKTERAIQELLRENGAAYRAPQRPALNGWGLSGSWNDGAESAVLHAAPGAVVFRFHARDLHVVLGPAQNGAPVRFRVTLDGHPPGDDHGVDSAPDGSGVVREPRLYQLVRQKGPIADRTLEIEFLDPGVHAYVFTFG